MNVLFTLSTIFPGEQTAGAHEIFVVFIAIFVYGIVRRGLKSITNWLLLIPIVMWGLQAFIIDTNADGCWFLSLIGMTTLIMFCWVGVGLNQDIDENSAT